jgi:protein TonB
LAIVGSAAAWTLLQDRSFVPFSSEEESSDQTASGAQSAHGSVAALFSGDDYPADAQMRDEQGTVGVELKIDKQGRVSRCNIAQSSNSKSLDSATCRILQQRARFTPARDNSGQPVEDTYTQRITWRLEG